VYSLTLITSIQVSKYLLLVELVKFSFTPVGRAVVFGAKDNEI